MRINIVNCLLTRRCNLKCEYCQISGNINTPMKPTEYPNADYFYKNEKDTMWWIRTLTKFYKHNKDVFFILYGGEPFIRWELLADLVSHLNMIGANYTIISSCNSGIEKNIYSFFNKVHKVKGFTASIDPGFYLKEVGSREEMGNDEIYKSCTGYRVLKDLMVKNLVHDPVAEITCDRNNICYLYDTVKKLTEDGIVSDITMLDVSKSNFYDFSNISNPANLVHPTPDVLEVFDKLMKDNSLKIHMKEYLLPRIYKNLPANMDCMLERNLSNITIDSTGELRLCLRIRGVDSPKYKVGDVLDDNGLFTESFSQDIYPAMINDKEVLCRGCMWSCMLMSNSNDCSGIANH